VTLRDEKVREAIFHCWELQQHGGQLRFQFRYITRGEATVEAGKPFGADNAGLELWSTAASALQDAVNVQLAAFAEKNGMLPAAAIRSRDALFQRVVSTAGQPKDRWLTRPPRRDVRRQRFGGDARRL